MHTKLLTCKLDLKELYQQSTAQHFQTYVHTGEGNGNPLQYSCLENPMGRGAWWVTVHGVAKSWTRRSDFTLMKREETGP